MTYELAKQLRDAGFQQSFDSHSGGKWIDVGGEIFDHQTGDENEVYVPTLSELISALGDKFGVLERFKDGTYGSYYPNDIGTSGLGNTPEAAVAKLWLALKNNQ